MQFAYLQQKQGEATSVIVKRRIPLTESTKNDLGYFSVVGTPRENLSERRILQQSLCTFSRLGYLDLGFEDEE